MAIDTGDIAQMIAKLVLIILKFTRQYAKSAFCRLSIEEKDIIPA